MERVLIKTIFFLLSLCQIIAAANLHFNLYKKEGKIRGNTLLVIGGIHGNEPGGYFAPSLLIMHYTIEEGALWIVPNLNFDSDIRGKRGVYGDMNRKFAKISQNDPDYKIVNDIKKIILDKHINLVLNLHDGHGFYRKSWENSIFNPKAWGQSCIIDQKILKNHKFGMLDNIAGKVIKILNKDLIKNHHIFNVKNTETRFKDEQMKLSLTYFAITHGKPAFAIETSKNLTKLYEKVFYQLKAIEAFMNIMQIKFRRDFTLNKKEVKKLLEDYGTVVINDKSIIDLNNVKSVLKYFPLNKSNNKAMGSHPLIALLKKGKIFWVMVGNKRLTTLYPEFRYEKKIDNISMCIDKEKKIINVPSIVKVKKSFTVNAPKGYRVNIIGFQKKGLVNENGIEISRKDINKAYSMDKQGYEYRIEIYNGKNFSGMVVVKFVKNE